MIRLHLPHVFITLIAQTADIVSALSSSLSLSAGFSIQDSAMDVTRSAPQGVYYHADVIYLLILLGINKGAYRNLVQANILYTPVEKTHPCTPYQVCDALVADRGV